MVTGDRLIAIKKGDDASVQIDTDGSPSRMDFSCPLLGINKELAKIDSSFVLELLKEETSSFSKGIYDYDMSATYQDGTVDTFIVGGKVAVI